jgi:hypothetical protein
VPIGDMMLRPKSSTGRSVVRKGAGHLQKLADNLVIDVFSQEFTQLLDVEHVRVDRVVMALEQLVCLFVLVRPLENQRGYWRSWWHSRLAHISKSGNPIFLKKSQVIEVRSELIPQPSQHRVVIAPFVHVVWHLE